MKKRRIAAVIASLFMFSVVFFSTKSFDRSMTARADYEFELIDDENSSESNEYSYDNDVIEFETIEIDQNSSSDSYTASETAVRSYNPVSAFIICLMIGLAAAFIAVSIMKSSMKSVHKKQGASDYRKQNGFKLDVKTDNFLGKRVEKTPVMRAENTGSQK
ncbi:MAG: hypothetical protein IKW96_10480 [Ruminococcus sp.]|uniref:hypothetical protein n=1 Tax=Ruminococcus sp. TaxID=41978 RepID=UPI002600FA2B|nr:hypothetical protein [Ruminococcus sp.]MBR5683675.1 hypothetical protein [Ruminococcus sp.]